MLEVTSEVADLAGDAEELREIVTQHHMMALIQVRQSVDELRVSEFKACICCECEAIIVNWVNCRDCNS